MSDRIELIRLFNILTKNYPDCLTEKRLTLKYTGISDVIEWDLIDLKKAIKNLNDRQPHPEPIK